VRDYNKDLEIMLEELTEDEYDEEADLDEGSAGYKLLKELVGCVGKKNSANSFYFCKKYELSGQQFRRIISAARRRGFPICANKYGYYMPESFEDVHETIHSLNSRADAIFSVARGLEQYCNKY